MKSSSDDPDLDDISNAPVHKQGWTKHLHELFKQCRRECLQKELEHYYATQYFRKWYRWTTYPTLIFATAAAVLASLNTTTDKCTSKSEALSLTVAIVTGLHSLMVSLTQFVEYGQRASKHSLCANNYASLARFITSEMFMRPSEREIPKIDFLVLSNQLDAISSNEPTIPPHIVKKAKAEMARREQENTFEMSLANMKDPPLATSHRERQRKPPGRTKSKNSTMVPMFTQLNTVPLSPMADDADTEDNAD